MIIIISFLTLLVYLLHYRSIITLPVDLLHYRSIYYITCRLLHYRSIYYITGRLLHYRSIYYITRRLLHYRRFITLPSIYYITGRFITLPSIYYITVDLLHYRSIITLPVDYYITGSNTLSNIVHLHDGIYNGVYRSQLNELLQQVAFYSLLQLFSFSFYMSNNFYIATSETYLIECLTITVRQAEFWHWLS